MNTNRIWFQAVRQRPQDLPRLLRSLHPRRAPLNLNIHARRLHLDHDR